MAKNLTIAGVNYPSVPGLSIPVQGGGSAYFPDTSGDTVTAAHLEQGYTAHDAQGNPVTGTLVPGGGGDYDVVLELVRDQTDDTIFVPTATYADWHAAIEAGKTVGLYVTIQPGEIASAQYQELMYDGDAVIGITYITEESIYDEDSGEYIVRESGMSFLPNDSCTMEYQYIYYDVSVADILPPSQAPEGYVYYDAGGKKVGTAPLGSDMSVQIADENVFVYAGIYPNDIHQTINVNNLPTTLSSSPSGALSQVLEIGRNTADRYINIHKYYYNGGYYKIKATPNGSATAPATISGTSATVSTGNNTLTLTKTVSVTPSVTEGYVTAGTAGNASVSLTASVTTQAAQTIHPSTSDQTIAASRYLTGAQTIKAVTMANLIADNIKQGVTVTVGDSTDDDCVASVTGTYSGGGDSKNAQIAQGFNRVAATTYTAVTGQSIKVSKTGTYDVYWSAWRTSTSGTSGTCLYVDSSAHSSGNQTTWDSTYTNAQSIHLSNVSLTANQTISVRARSRSTSYYTYVFNLTIIEA